MRPCSLYMWMLVVGTILLNANAFAQIAQDRPELCGTPTLNVPLPQGVTAIEATHLAPVLMIAPTGSTSSRTIPMEFGSRLTEVCPLGADRLLVFGLTVVGSYDVLIVDRKEGKLIDSFQAYDPVVSPDQRWLMMRDFYPAQSELPVSEEYLLYDLASNVPGSNVPNEPVYLEAVRGRVVYPAVNGGVPFEHAGLQSKETHIFRSKSFYWGPDSGAVVFADSVESSMAIVMVEVDAGGAKAYVHQLSESEVCEQGTKAGSSSEVLTVSDAKVGRRQGDDRAIELQLRSSHDGACRPLPLILHKDAFKPARIEVHAPRQRPGIPVLMKK